jgi:hypothetical protein
VSGSFSRNSSPNVFEYHLSSSLVLCVVFAGSRTYFIGDKNYVVKALSVLRVPTEDLKKQLDDEEIRRVPRRRVKS